VGKDKLKHMRAAIEDARVGIDAAGNALERARQYLRDLSVGDALPPNPDARAEMMTSVRQAIDAVEKDLRKLDELQLRLLQDLYRLSG
jgi:hypothetical protein